MTEYAAKDLRLDYEIEDVGVMDRILEFDVASTSARGLRSIRERTQGIDSLTQGFAPSGRTRSRSRNYPAGRGARRRLPRRRQGTLHV